MMACSTQERVEPTNAMKAICRAALKGEPGNADRLIDSAIEWESVWDVAEAEHVTYWCLDFTSRHPETIAARRHDAWRMGYMKQIILNRSVLSQLADITQALASENIDLIALKGSAMLLWLYSDLGARALADIDILVPESRMLDAIGLLEQRGYSVDYGTSFTRSLDITCHICRMQGSHMPQMRKQGLLAIEPHFRFMKGCCDWGNVKDDAWSEKRQISYVNTQIYCLAPHHALIHAAIHYMRHLNTGTRQYRRLFDIAMMVSRPNVLDWDQVWRTADHWGVSSHLRNALEIVCDDFDLSLALPEYTTSLPTNWNSPSLLSTFRCLPTFGMKFYWLYRLLFPPPSAIRRRFNLPDACGLKLFGAYLRLYTDRIIRRMRR